MRRRLVQSPDLHTRLADKSTFFLFLSLSLRRILRLTVRILFTLLSSVASSHVNKKFAQCSVVDALLPLTSLLLMYSSLAAFVPASLAFPSSVFPSNFIALQTLGQNVATASGPPILLLPTSRFNFD